MRLRHLQQELQRDLLGDPSDIAGQIVDAAPLCAEARLAIYRNAYRCRLTEALAEAYAVLHALLGDETFASLCELFIARHPSAHRSIRWYGGALPDFLCDCAPFKELPLLAELARFEWSLGEAFDAADAAPLERAALKAVAARDWAHLRFRFHPSVRRLSLAWNAVAVWRAIRAGEEPPEPAREAHPMRWLIWRQGFQNHFRSIDEIEEAALEAARNGESFAELCAALTRRLPEDEIPPRAAALLGAWTDGGLIVDCR